MVLWKIVGFAVYGEMEHREGTYGRCYVKVRKNLREQIAVAAPATLARLMQVRL